MFFSDFKEFNQFMIFAHTHYELCDVWHYKNGNKGILFEGWFDNTTGNQKYNPCKLPEDEQPTQRKRVPLEEVYETWLKVKNNLRNEEY